MILQSNSYIVPKEKRAEHARLVRKFRQTLNRLGCEQFDVFEQVGANWLGGETTGRFVQMMRFRDRKHQLAVQTAERQDQAAQDLIAEFCELINFPYQQQQGLFAVGFYQSVLPVTPSRHAPADTESSETPETTEAAETESMHSDSAVGVGSNQGGLRMVEEGSPAVVDDNNADDNTPGGNTTHDDGGDAEAVEVTEIPDIAEPPEPSH